MLLNESQSLFSPSRNSSPDVIVLALTNPDTGHPGDKSHPPTPPGVSLLLLAIITVHNTNPDKSDEPLERERARTSTGKQPQGWNPGDTLRNEGTNDKNISDPITIATRVPSNNGTTTIAEDVVRPGLLVRGRPHKPSHEQAIPIPILPGPSLHSVPSGRPNATAMGRPTGGTNPHTGELE